MRKMSFWEFDIYFLGLPWEIFFGVITDNYLHLYPLKNVKKKNSTCFKLFWYKVSLSAEKYNHFFGIQNSRLFPDFFQNNSIFFQTQGYQIGGQ